MIQSGQLDCCWALEIETLGFKFELLAMSVRCLELQLPSLLDERVVVWIRTANTEPTHGNYYDSMSYLCVSRCHLCGVSSPMT